MIFPTLIQQDLGATCVPVPACTYCHRDNNGGTGTVTTRFGRTMLTLGLVAESPATLSSALNQARSARIDSDGDGDTDIDALMACRDPNLGYTPPPATVTPDGGGTSAAAIDSGTALPPSGGVSGAAGPADPTPEYGCAVAHRSSPDAGAASVTIGALLWLSRRRRRSSAV